MRYTVDGSQALEDRISQDLSAIREAVLAQTGEGDSLGLVLGGGYGRGEGGVYVVDGEERVYNDYDFFVIVPYSSRVRQKSLMKSLAKVKVAMEPRCGIHVDFGPAMSEASLPSLPYEVMFMELREGHHVVIGPDDILASMPSYDTSHPPLEECARLFMNRGVGLLLARQKMSCEDNLDSKEKEFVVRNIRKAQLAMGDAILFLRGCYSPGYQERLARFHSLDISDVPEGEKLRQYYDEAIQFKLRPNHRVPGEHTLQSWFEDVTELYERMFLWFEQNRLDAPELTWDSYRRLSRRLSPCGMRENAKNVLRNLRVNASQLPPVRELFLHPRDRVLAHLPALLFCNQQDEQITADLLRLWEHCG